MEYITISSEDACGYIRQNFEVLRDNGFNPNTVLDIGAAHGHFSEIISTIFPNTYITALECNERDRYFLESKPWDVRFVCLGDKPCTKDFYIDRNSLVGGGSSFYLEDTSAFADPIVETKKIVTLDSLELGSFDLVKIDTQGSELDILRGGMKTIGNSRVVMMELSFLPYNKAGCLFDDVVIEMRKLGFRTIDTFGPSFGGHWWHGRKVQADVIFVKETDPLFSMPA
jgi:FkbM family methyltransferase